MVRAARIGVALLLLCAVGGCDSGFLDFVNIPSVQRTASTAGIVASVEVREGPAVVVLADGERISLEGRPPLIRIGTIERGGLFLAGDDPESWYAFISEAVPGCFALTTRGNDAGPDIVTELGLRLTKTADFVAPVDANQKYRAVPGFPFCLDSNGHVFSYDSEYHERSLEPLPPPPSP